MSYFGMDYKTTFQEPIPTRDGYTFIGWYLQNKDGSESLFNFGTQVTDALTNGTYRGEDGNGEEAPLITLKAKWKKEGSYPIRFKYTIVDENGTEKTAQYISDESYADQASVTLPTSVSSVPEGKRLKGWLYNGNEYKPGEVITLDASTAVKDAQTGTLFIEITAVYESDVVATTDVTLDGNGGVTAEGNTSFTFNTNEFTNGTENESFVLPENTFTRNGYTFVGWSDDYGDNNSVQYKVGADYKYAANEKDNKLYAVWKKNEVRLRKVDGNTDEKLTGANFKVYTDQNRKQEVKFNSTGNVYTATYDGTGSAVITAGYKASEDAEIQDAMIYGLNPGITYYIVETSAPAGYNLASGNATVSFSRSGSDLHSEGTNSSNTKGGVVTDENTKVLTIVFADTAGTTLPNTGGPGTTGLKLGGMLLIAAAGILLTKRHQHDTGGGLSQ